MRASSDRTGADWLLEVLLPRQVVQLSVMRAPEITLQDTAQGPRFSRG